MAAVKPIRVGSSKMTKPSLFANIDRVFAARPAEIVTDGTIVRILVINWRPIEPNRRSAWCGSLQRRPGGVGQTERR